MDNVVVVDNKDEVTGTMPRAEAHKNGTPHRIAVVYLENEKGQILIQVRKSGILDHSSAGHVDPGETYLETAFRELGEELGIKEIKLTLVGKGISNEVKQDTGEHRVHVFEIFVCKANPGKLNKEEVRDVYWANPSDVFRQMNDKSENKKFSGGFRASLPIYLQYKKYSG